MNWDEYIELVNRHDGFIAAVIDGVWYASFPDAERRAEFEKECRGRGVTLCRYGEDPGISAEYHEDWERGE